MPVALQIDRFQNTLRQVVFTWCRKLRNGKYRASVNRSYYEVFHSIRAITALDHFDSSKHSGVIAFFNQHYVKPGVFDKELSKMIASCYRLREKLRRRHLKF
ncbi:MAG: HEPN domain-containing protein [Clostridia bacterium]|nr:HEPN domain-containing protein [Clostridia bacterium]